MAKEEKEERKERDRGEERDDEEREKKPKKHLHSIRIEHVVNEHGKHKGFIAHHTYKKHHADNFTEPEKPMATHDTAEEAGEHVREQFGAAEGAGGGGEPEEGAEEAQGGASGAAAGGAAGPGM